MKHFSMMILLFAVNASAVCDLSPRPVSYRSSREGTDYDLFTVPASSLREAGPAKVHGALLSFRSSVAARTDVRQDSLLRRQKKFFDRMPSERQRYEKILSGSVGRLRPVSCLESFLHDNHLRRFSGETEFAAYVLTRKGSRDAVVLVLSQRTDGVSMNDFLWEILKKHRHQGWKVAMHLHNHPFFFNNPYGDIAGTVLPSAPDLETYVEGRRSFGLESAVVTNGFDSFELSAAEFSRL